MLVLFEALARPSLEFSPLCAVYAMMDYNAFFYYKVPVALTVQKNIFHKENSRELSGEAIKIRGSKNRSTKKKYFLPIDIFHEAKKSKFRFFSLLSYLVWRLCGSTTAVGED